MILGVVLALASADCAGCHPAQAERLEASRHATASQLAIFQVSAAKANTRWCATCHRPAGKPAAGLVCASCHAVAGDPAAIRAARTPTADATAAHAVVVDADLGKTSCARCHEFATPLPEHLDPVVYSLQPLQSTVSELARTDPRARCADCHDPHAPLGAHDPALVRAAITVTARSTFAGVELRVTARHVGHRFPTGDPFRRLVLSVCDDPACTQVVGQDRIARGFALVDGVYAPVIDHTLGDGETRTFQLPRGRWWRAELFYGDPRFEAQLPASEVSFVLASGAL